MDNRDAANQPPSALQELLRLNQAYDRQVISYEEWLQLAKAWARAVMRQDGTTEQEQSTDCFTEG